MENVLEQVKKIVSEKLDIEAGSIRAESSFIDDLGADSLDITELVMLFENKFSISIPDSEMEKFKTVDDVVKFIESQKK